MPFSGPIEDRNAIRDLYDAYADAACRGDRADWLACFAEDGNWWTHYFDVTGHAAIGAQYDQLMANVKTTIFQSQVGSIEIEGDSAHCRALSCERLLINPEGEMRLSGIYHDDLVRRDGKWLFSKRIYKVSSEELIQPHTPVPQTITG